MTGRKGATRSDNSRTNLAARIKDEVYRQMYRLEERRPKSEIGLALALLHAWMESGSEREGSEDRDWLKRISPICLAMIESSLKVDATGRPPLQ
jgi:hypothetical protein